MVIGRVIILSTANMPRIYNQHMELEGILEKAYAIGYKQIFNDIWTASFTLPADDPKNKYCKPFNYVEIFDGKRRIELFRIMPSNLTREGRQGFIVYECEHVITTLLDDVLFMFHQIGNIGVFTREAINYVLNFQTVKNWQLGRCDFNHQFLYKWESDNLLAALFSIPRPFSDWHFTYDTTTYPWTINLVRADSEISCEIRHGKNMQGIERQIDPTNLVTRLIPLGFGEGINQLTIESVNNGRNYLEADTINIWGAKTTIWTDRRFEDAANLKATGQAMLERLKNPWISYTVKSIDLFKKTMQDFDKFQEGRKVRVIDKVDDIVVDTRIMAIDKPDVTKADISVIIENHDRNVAGSIAALQERARINDTYAQGAETLIMIPYINNCQPQFPAIFEFFIPQEMVNINQAFLRLRLEPFRANSRAVRGGGGRTETTTDGGGTTATTTNGGGTTQSTTQQATQTPTTSQQAQEFRTTESSGETTSRASSRTTTANARENVIIGTTRTFAGTQVWDLPTSSVGTPPHSHSVVAHGHNITIDGHTHDMDHTHTIPAHSHSFTIPAHQHTVTIPPHDHSVTIPAHSHTVTIPSHSHSITLPDHTHEIEFGIFQGTTAQSVSIRLDNNLIPINMQQLDNIDIRPFLRRDGGGRIARGTFHRLEIVPDRMTRISAMIFMNIFTNSRGGGIS